MLRGVGAVSTCAGPPWGQESGWVVLGLKAEGPRGHDGTRGAEPRSLCHPYLSGPGF